MCDVIMDSSKNQEQLHVQFNTHLICLASSLHALLHQLLSVLIHECLSRHPDSPKQKDYNKWAKSYEEFILRISVILLTLIKESFTHDLHQSTFGIFAAWPKHGYLFAMSVYAALKPSCMRL